MRQIKLQRAFLTEAHFLKFAERRDSGKMTNTTRETPNLDLHPETEFPVDGKNETVEEMRRAARAGT